MPIVPVTSARVSKAFFTLGIFLLLAIHLYHGLFRIADPDEFQTLTNAFLASKGHVLYRDFWDNHGPLATWLWQPLLYAWHGGHGLIFWLRALAWINTIAIAGVSWITLRRLYPDQTLLAAFAIVFLLGAPSFLFKSLEIRGDNPANLLATVAFGSTALGLQFRNPRLLIAAGFALGLILCFSLKAIILVAALGIFSVCICVYQKYRPRWQTVLLAFIAAIIPPAVCATILQANESMRSFELCYFGANSSRNFAGFTSSEIAEILKKAPGWSIFLLAGLVSSVRRMYRRQADGVEAGSTLMLLFYVGQFIFLLPTKNMQSLLPGYVPGAVVAGMFAQRLSGRLTAKTFATGLALLFVTFVYGLWSYNNIDNRELPKQVRFADAALELAQSSPQVFDPSGVVFLKPKPLPFPILVTFLRDMHNAGDIDLTIKEQLEQEPAMPIVFDKRTAELRTEDLAYLRANYAPTLAGPNCLLLLRNGTAEAVSLQPIQSAKAIEWWTIGRKRKHPPVPGSNTKWFEEYLALYRANHPQANL